jgi:hypothetical protein
MWLFAAPLVFWPAFSVGYGDHVHLVLAAVCALLMVAAAASGFAVRSLPVRTWAGVDAALALFCALGVLDNVVNHNEYSGYGAIILVPLAVVETASLVVRAIYVTATNARRKASSARQADDRVDRA